MKFTITMAVERDRLFDAIIENFKQDFAIDTDVVCGQSYPKINYHQQKSIAKVQAVRKDEYFALGFSTNLGVSKISYLLYSENGITYLSYTEDYKAASLLKELNYQLVRLIGGWYFRKMRIAQLRAMEQRLRSTCEKISA